MIKVATQSTGENVNFPLNVVEKKMDSLGEKLKLDPYFIRIKCRCIRDLKVKTMKPCKC